MTGEQGKGRVAAITEAMQFQRTPALQTQLGIALWEEAEREAAVVRDAARLKPQDRRALAVGVLRAAVALNPNDWSVRNWLAFALLETNDPAAALPVAKEAVRLGPQVAQTHWNLGRAQLGTGNLEGAIASFRAALKLCKSTPGVAWPLGEIPTEQQRHAFQTSLDAALKLQAERAKPKPEAPPPREKKL